MERERPELQGLRMLFFTYRGGGILNIYKYQNFPTKGISKYLHTAILDLVAQIETT